MSHKRIVIIEDEPDILEVLAYNLKREGFEIATREDGARGCELVRKTLPDLVLLDLMLPSMDGHEVCRLLKNHSETERIPIIMVTAKSEESDVVLGLGIGADDYIPKPFSPKELIARVKALLRRCEQEGQSTDSNVIEIDGLVIDSDKHSIAFAGAAINLTASEFRILRYLANHPGRAFSREQILNHAFGLDAAVVDRNIDVHIRAIRKKIGDEYPFIETVRGVGYRFKERS